MTDLHVEQKTTKDGGSHQVVLIGRAARLAKKKSGADSDDHWYKKPVGIVVLAVTAGILVWLATEFFHWVLLVSK